MDDRWTYSVTYSRRKTIGIYVSAESGVEVRVPHFVSRREADDFVKSKRLWIERQLSELAKRPPKFEPTFEWGQACYFLGEKQVFHYSDEDNVDWVLPGSADDAPDRIESKVQRLFKQQAGELFAERHQYWRERMEEEMRLPPSTLHIRSMKRRWGTCRNNGKIIINTNLARYPLNCVDVVIVHELCHLLEFNHSRRFYHLLGQVIPEWKGHDEMLNRLSLLY